MNEYRFLDVPVKLIVAYHRWSSVLERHGFSEEGIDYLIQLSILKSGYSVPEITLAFLDFKEIIDRVTNNAQTAEKPLQLPPEVSAYLYSYLMQINS